MKEKTNLKGISLIVLIITIIVIIILATAIIISISDNDVMDEADTARYESDRANMQALLTATINEIATQNLGTVKVQATQINKVTSGEKQVSGEITYTVKSRVNTANTSGTIVFDKGTNTATTYYTGKQLPIYALGETKWYVDNEGKIVLYIGGYMYGSTLPNFVKNNVQLYYGKKVLNYKTGDEDIDSQVEWQIFHSDGNNIYLIATDYIDGSLVPAGKGGTALNFSDAYVRFSDVIADYTGSVDITDTTLQGLNSKYYEYLTEEGTTNGVNGNMQAVAYLMDTSENVWGKFAGEDAIYAIGGPTLELFLDSYNNKYNTEYRYKVEWKSGYEISKDNGANWSSYYGDMIDKTDTQYVLPNPDNYGKTWGMWLYSPGRNENRDYTNYIMRVNSNGLIGGLHYSNGGNNCGLRPVVCLNSNILFEETEGGVNIK